MKVRILWVCFSLLLGTLVFGLTAAAAPGDAPAGQVLYGQFCVSCHGLAGQGGPMAAMLKPRPRNLADAPYMSSRSDQHLFEVISRGGPAVGLAAAMPAFGAQLAEQQIWDTVAYVRTLTQNAPAATEQARPSSATANTPATGVTIARLRLSIWPEYDDPRVLIMLRGDMTPRQAFPGTITLPLPQGAEIIGAGIISEQNELIVHPYNVVPGDPLDSIQLNLPTPRFFLEFYYKPFANDTAEKRFTYSAPTTYPIELLEVDIQQPLQSTNFRVDPPAMERRVEQKFTYHQSVYRDVAAGQPRAFQVAYIRTTQTPSVPKQQTPPARPGKVSSALRTALLPLGILASATLIFTGWVWLLCSHRPQPVTTTAGQAPARSLEDTLALLLQDNTPSPADAASLPLLAQRGGNFCAHCGRKLLSEDRFCAGCGKPLTR